MKKQKGFSLIELLIVVAIILIIAAIAIPNLLRSKMAYATAYPAINYSIDMPSLGGPPATCATVAVSTAACLIDDVLATATAAATAKSGYFFTYAVTTTAGTLNTAYTLNATPANPGTTGQRYFFTDQSGVIRYGLTGAADATSSAIQ